MRLNDTPYLRERDELLAHLVDDGTISVRGAAAMAGDKDWPRYDDGSPMGYKGCERCGERTPYPWLNYSATLDDRLMCPECVVEVERQYRQQKASGGDGG